jgi:aspartyl protease family protein
MAGSASLLWVVAGIVGLITVAPELDGAMAPASEAPEAAGFAIERARDGQFYTDAMAGSASIRMMVDPGADRVLLAAVDAQRLGFEVTPTFTPVVIADLAVGPHRFKDVAAVIAPDLPVSLLGRSFLSRLPRVKIQRDNMVLR